MTEITAPASFANPMAGEASPKPSRAQDLLLLALYAAGFLLTHAIALRWGGAGFYSLWYPAAGLRLALLWRAGVRWTLPVAATEVLIDAATGAISLSDGDAAVALLSVVRPVFAYGIVIWAVRRVSARSWAEMLAPPMPFALAAVLAPCVAALLAVPQALWRGDLTGVASVREITLSLNAFVVGDLLGNLLIAPPLLWAATRITGHGITAIPRPRAGRAAEALLILGIGALVSETLARLDLGPQPAPLLLTVSWVGLRFGRAAAWAALVLICIAVLPQTASAMALEARLQFHLGLASIAVAGYLAGSFHDAQVKARADLERRDRLLFQAERLKTLRAMSVAVIHEISQPLSTLAIEAHHLHELTVDAPSEIAATAALIDRKAGHLSELVRRLRRYGGRAVDEPSPLPLAALVESVVALARTETAAAGVGLAVAPVARDLVVLAQEVELAQAIVNLIRNAVQACGPGAEVTLAVNRNDNNATITVTNRCVEDGRAQPGMGVGTLVAKAIVEAHGGTLTREVGTDSLVRATIYLPLIGAEV